MGLFKEARQEMARARTESSRRVACSLLPTIVQGIAELANVSELEKYHPEVRDKLATSRLVSAERLLTSQQEQLAIRGCSAVLRIERHDDNVQVVANCSATDCLRQQS